MASRHFMNNRDLAKYFGISPSAFSLIINNKPGVSDATRARVIAELQSMGYSNLIKTSAPAETVRNLLFVVFKRDGAILDMHPFFMLLIENIENRARRYGYNIMFSTFDLRSNINEQIERVNSLNTSGAIIFATEMLNSDISYFSSYKKPFLLFDNDFHHMAVNTVTINNEMGTWQAIEHLVKMGHKKIGYLACKSRISSFKERESGYRSALEEFGMSLQEESIYHLDFTEEGSYRDFAAILKDQPSLPTAFVSDDDTIALGAMRALKEYGYSIPDDVSIIGYDDRPSCEIASTPLTTINVSKNSFAADAVDVIAGIIENQKNPESAAYRTLKVRVETFLVVRDSVKDLNKS